MLPQLHRKRALSRAPSGSWGVVPARAPGGPRVGAGVFVFGPRCAEDSARRNPHSLGQVAAAIDAAAVFKTGGANPHLQNYLSRA